MPYKHLIGSCLGVAFQELGEWISLVGFHRLIDQKQED